MLAARKDPAGLSGEVLIDGAPQPPNFKCLSGYVVQVCHVKKGTLTTITLTNIEVLYLLFLGCRMMW